MTPYRWGDPTPPKVLQIRKRREARGKRAAAAYWEGYNQTGYQPPFLSDNRVHLQQQYFGTLTEA